MSNDTCEKHNWWYDLDLCEKCPECVAEKRERKRIIKLLKAHVKEAQYRAPSQTSLFYFAQEITNAIALIKGGDK